MATISCPVCGEDIRLASDIELDSHIDCPECGALLEVANDEPLEVVVVDIDFSSDEDELGDGDEIDDDDL